MYVVPIYIEVYLQSAHPWRTHTLVNNIHVHYPLLKMPPYFDGPHYDRAAKVLNQYSHVVKYVASINTVGNCLSVDPVAEMPAIRSNGGFAGLSGR